MKRIVLICFLAICSFNGFAVGGDSLINKYTITGLYEIPLDSLFQLKVVTPGKTGEKIEEIPASIFILSRGEIEKLGFQSLEEILGFIPGMYSLGNAYWRGGTNYGMRGFASPSGFSTMMIMVNGVNQMEDFSLTYSTDQINVPVEAIDRVEVIRGPMAVIYGSNAFMGVINIITNEGESTKIAQSYGSLETYRTSISVNQKVTKDIKISINGSWQESNGLDLSYQDLQSDTAVIKGWGLEHDATTKNQYQSSKYYFNTSTKYKNWTAQLSHTSLTKGVAGSIPSANTEHGYLTHLNHSVAQLGYKKQVTDRIRVEAKGSFFSYSLEGQGFRYTPITYGNFRTTSKAREIEVNSFYKISRKFDLTVGLYNRSALEVSQRLDYPRLASSIAQDVQYSLPYDQNIYSSAIFSQLKYQLSKGVNIVLGGRIEKHNNHNLEGLKRDNETGDTDLIEYGIVEQNKPQFIPRIAMIYKLNKQNYLKVLFGQSEKRSSVFENVNFISKSLNQLNFAKMTTTEVMYFSQLFYHTQLSTSLFFNDLDNLVIRDFNIDANTITTTNTGKIQSTGIEVSITNKLIPKTVIWADIMYQRSLDLTDSYKDVDLAFSPDLLGYFFIQHQLTSKFFIGLKGNYVSDMHAAWNLTSEERYGDDTPQYFNLDMNIRYNDIWKGMFVSANVQNILGQEIRYPSHHLSPWTDKGMLGNGRLFFVTVGVEFK